MRKLLISAFYVAVLTSCSHSTSRTGTLTITPTAVKECGGKASPVALSVHWDARKALPHGGSVKLWINNKVSNRGIFGDDGNNGTLWLQGGIIGSSTTGVWVMPGTRITMTEASKGKVLARLDVPAAPCQ